jgi:quinol monooxygenase YgiN
MNSYRLGLSLLKLKLPHLRGQLDSAFLDNEALLHLCEAYAEATSYRDLLRRGGDPGLIHVKEMWRDQAALDLHFGSPHIAVWRASWPELGVGERKLRLYEVGEPRET